MPTVTDDEIRVKLKAGWLFPAAMAKRWGVAPVTVWGGIKSGRLIHVRSVSGTVLLDPTQSRAGALSK